MTEFLTAAVGFILALLALGLVSILRGPGDADRMMATQLIGTGGIARCFCSAPSPGVPAAVDVALTLALLATFASIAFVKKGLSRLEADGVRDRRRTNEPRTRHHDDCGGVGRRVLLSGRHGRPASLSRHADASRTRSPRRTISAWVSSCSDCCRKQQVCATG